MNRIVIYILLLSFSKLSFAQPQLSLMPWPEEVVFGRGQMRLTSDFTISVSQNATDKLCRYATRILRRIDGRSGMFFKQETVANDRVNPNAALLIQTTRPGLTQLGEDESYHLRIENNQIFISAETEIGAMRALETVVQLLRVDSRGFYFPELTINDQPRFPWRGLLIDVGRHFMPINVIKRNLDGMAAVKMNVLHLHLSEDQGFRIESKIYPKLHELGSNGEYFTQEEIKEIIRYADDRGIRVMPEFDMPAHASSWLVGYPELASAPGPYEIETGFGVKDPVMDPTSPVTYVFLDQFIGEMAALFPDPYFHIGGDENNGVQWNASQSIQKFMRENSIANNHELQSYFNEKILSFLQKYRKKMVGWDEIYQPGISKDIVIQSWRGKDALFESAFNGYKTFLSNGYYIDLAHPAINHYLNDPLPEDHPLPDDKVGNILGGEATMWSELITKETIDSRIWPRTAAIAERLWSPGYIRDEREMYRRLDDISIDLEELGLMHLRNQDVLLRRIANGQQIHALKELIGLLEPVKGYERHNRGVSLTTHSPLTRLPDAAVPDSKPARDFRFLVEDYLQSGEENLRQEIFNQLMFWKEIHKKLEPITVRAPLAEDALKYSRDIESLCAIGVQAVSVNMLHSQRWKDEVSMLLDAVNREKRECEIMIVGAIEALVKVAK
ncbi:MAG TPA: family 20 glycosylhydrolase [Cyclobacteriaceae bacterium]